ncbi:MAG: DUF4199 domain-containing protein [Crocinitomicaceae bacterium]|nr:DUF4199 domain-containing protein [Crocinitomicaceae bacterium]
MRITVKTGIISALSWIGIKMGIYYTGLFERTIIPAVLLNILGLLACISIGLYLQKRRDTEETNTMIDLKNAMSAGVPYVLMVSIFIYFFYAKINPEYYQHQIAENEIAIEKMVNDPIALEKFKSQQADAEVMTKEQIEKKLKQSNKQGASAGFTATLSTLALLILATLYSLLVTIIYRRIVFRS